MFSRTRHLACLLLLLSSFGAAQSSRGETVAFRGTCIEMVLYRQAAAANTLAQAAESRRVREQKAEDVTTLPQAAQVTINTAWTMQPAAQQAVSVHTLTSLAIV